MPELADTNPTNPGFTSGLVGASPKLLQADDLADGLKSKTKIALYASFIAMRKAFVLLRGETPKF